jgi:hypothetical protein
MNKAQRKELKDVIAKLLALGAMIDDLPEDEDEEGEVDFSAIDTKAMAETIEAAGTVIAEMAEAEREKYDNMNEGLQNSETGQNLDSAATTLEGIEMPEVPETFDQSSAEDFMATLQEVTSELEQLADA